MPTHAVMPGSDRLAGRLAILGGLSGIVAFICLMLFLATRPSGAEQGTSHLLLRSHDVAVVLQSLCLIPLVLALKRGATAVAFLSLVAVLILLGTFNVIADVLYMIPQGALGGWLIFMGLQATGGLPRGLRILSVVAGIGLVLVSLFPIGYALFVDPAILLGPVGDDDPTPPGTDRANGIVHILLAIGTVIGCSTYPIWSALAGRWLLLRGGR